MFDTRDPLRVATFWAGALGFEFVEADATGGYIADPSGRTPGALFLTVPEPKIVKNRIHLDVRPTDSMKAGVERVQELGGTVRGFIQTDDSFWTQMRDVEGNEFCVLRGPEDGWSDDQVSM